MRAAFQTQGAPVLNCPGCNTQVADGTAICPSCDYIIDSSFLSTNASDGEASGASRKQQGAARPARPRAPSASRAAGVPAARAKPAAEPEPEPELARDDATKMRSAEEILRNAPPRAANARSGPRPAAGAAPGRSSAPRREAEFDSEDDLKRGLSRESLDAPEQAIADFRDYVRDLGSADRISLWSALIVVGSSFLPWLETAEEGDLLGLVSKGFLCVLMALGVIGTMTVRTRRLLPNLNVLVPWFMQMGLAVVSTVWCLIFMKLSYDATEVPSPIGNSTIMNSSPSFGAYIGLIGCVGMVVGSLMGLKEKPAS
jgi:hypothetical protein